MKGQMASIALVVATGIMAVITMRGSYESLIDAQQAYYRQTRFADIWVPLKRAPESVRREIEAIPGVDRVDTRVTLLATLDLEHLNEPAQGRFVSVPERGFPILNDLHLREGRYLRHGAPDEVIISENFAKANDFRPGDAVRALINGRSRKLDIVGIAITPEHAYAVPPGALYPDDERYGVFWMDVAELGPAYDMDGAFNEAFVTLTEDGNRQEVITRLDRLLDPYGGLGAYPREDQLSHQILEAELDQNRVLGTAIPAVFLAIAAFLLNLVLGRLIASQRGEIGVLKAFGYRDAEVGRHFLSFALVAVTAGAVVGTLAGMWLGDIYIALYGQYFDFPDLRYRLSPRLVAIAVLISVVAAGAGALGAVRRAARLPPAEAMRPEPPARFRASWLERSGLDKLVPAAGLMILRNLERRPVTSLLSSLGVAFSVAILVIGMFMFDSINYMMDLQFRVIQREDLMLSFNEPLDDAIRYDLENLPGVTLVETFRTVPVRLRSEHRDQEAAIEGLSDGARLRRIVNAKGRLHPTPTTGVVLNERLAEKLRVRRGDMLQFEVLQGRREAGEMAVAGIVDDFLGMSAYMSRDGLDQLTGREQLASGAYLSVTADAKDDLNRRLKNLPAVAGVASPASMLESFESQLAEGLFIGLGFLLGFAGVIAVGVIYNGARIALSERGRELASLRVMGFRRSETAVLLLGEQAVITLTAIPLGWVLGYGLSGLVAASLETDAYRFPFVINIDTYLWAALITIIAAAMSAALIRRRVDRLDLIAVLKTRE